jgi:hypothetical protein
VVLLVALTFKLGNFPGQYVQGIIAFRGQPGRRTVGERVFRVGIEGKVIGTGDRKASFGEWVFAPPGDDGPIEGEKLMGVSDESFVESAPERGVVIMRGTGAKIGRGVG